MAYVLKHAVGNWAYTFVIISVIVSVIGGWIAWTLMCAQVPYTAAQVQILPKSFLRENKKSTPIYALLISSIIMQVFMVMVVMAKSVYDAAIDITGVMILPAYLFCGLYLVKASFMKGELKTTDAPCRTLVGIGHRGLCRDSSGTVGNRESGTLIIKNERIKN